MNATHSTMMTSNWKRYILTGMAVLMALLATSLVAVAIFEMHRDVAVPANSSPPHSIARERYEAMKQAQADLQNASLGNTGAVSTLDVRGQSRSIQEAELMRLRRLNDFGTIVPSSAQERYHALKDAQVEQRLVDR